MKKEFIKKIAVRFAVLVAAIVVMPIESVCVAADISVSLSLDQAKVTTADTAKLVVSVTGGRHSDSDPNIQGLDVFRVTSGGTSSHIEIVNGQVTSGLEYSYFLQPVRTGTFQVGPAQVVVDGKTYRSNAATLAVIDTPSSVGAKREILFLTSTISSKTAYLEQELIYTVKLYRQIRITDVSLELPEVKGLTFKQLGKHSEYQGLYNGESYTILEVTYSVVASKDGVFAISPASMSMTAHQASRQPTWRLFEDPFLSLGRPVRLSSESIELKIKSLPQVGRAADFSGLLGHFKMEATLEPQEVRVGESATLTVKISGRGNFARTPDLELPEIRQIKTYADQPVVRVNTDNQGTSGTKTMKWALVPEREGQYQIPQLKFSYFDIASEQYREIATPSFLLAAVGSGSAAGYSIGAATGAGTTRTMDAGQHLAGRPSQKEAIRELGRDILPIHTSARQLEERPIGFGGTVVCLLALLGPVGLYAAAALSMRMRHKSVKLMPATKSKKAAKRFAQRSMEPDLTADKIVLYVRDYLNERFFLSLGALTSDDARQIAEQKGVTVKTAEELRGFIKSLEDLIYTGKGDEVSNMGTSARELVDRIHKEAR